MKSILYSGTSWTFLKLNTLVGLIAMLGHGDIIGSLHFTPPYQAIAVLSQQMSGIGSQVANIVSFHHALFEDYAMPSGH